MSRQTIGLGPQLYDYILDTSVREPELLQRLRQETADLPEANMQIAPDQGQFMSMLVKLTEAYPRSGHLYRLQRPGHGAGTAGGRLHGLL